METIGLELRLAKEEFIFWESMPVNVTVSNKGDAAVDLPQGEAIPITYEFRSPSDGETKASVLATNRWEMLTRDKDSPPREISEEELEPGKTRELVADPVLYAMKGLPPGDYRLVGVLEAPDGDVESDPAPVRVVPARIGHVSTQWCSFRKVRPVIFDHEDSDGDRWLFHLESMGHFISSDVFRRGGRLEGPGPVEGLAVSMDVEAGCSGRWSAWLQDGRFNALCWELGVVGKPSPVPVGLENARLIQPGFQFAPQGGGFFAVGEGLFFVAGTDGGKVRIKAFRTSKEKIVAVGEMPLGKVLPERILGRCTPAKAGSEIDLAWSETENGATRVFNLACDKKANPSSSKPLLLYERESALLAMEMAPVGLGSEGYVHALFGLEEADDPADPAKKMNAATYAIFPTRKPSANPETFVLRAPAEPANLWAISPYPIAVRLVLAHAGKNIVHAVAGDDSGWTIAQADIDDVQALFLISSDHNPNWYPMWASPSSGVDYREFDLIF